MSNRGGKRAGAGRLKGSTSKWGSDIKDGILQAYEELGGVEWLKDLANDEPKAFAMLLARILPRDINANIESGEDQIKVLLAGRERSNNHLNLKAEIEPNNGL